MGVDEHGSPRVGRGDLRRVSDPQFEWGTEVLERLQLRGDEAAIDAGCGSGKVTEKLLERLPAALLAVDGSAAMIEKAEERLGEGRPTSSPTSPSSRSSGRST